MGKTSSSGTMGMKPSFRPHLNTTVLYAPVLCTIWCNIQTGFFFASAHTHVNTSTELRCLLQSNLSHLSFANPQIYLHGGSTESFNLYSLILQNMYHDKEL